MKGISMRQLHRLLSSTTIAECRPTSIFHDGGRRRMVTSAENLLSKSNNHESVVEKAKSRWYRPDPETGTWLPEVRSEGQETSPKEFAIPPSLVVSGIRAESTTDSTVDKTWWTSMEELPDMDRAAAP